MNKKANFCCIFLFFTLCFGAVAGERTIPVDVFLMIDKSLSMEEPGKFDSLQKWVLDELINQMLIPGDWVTIYQFYEKPEHVLTTNVQNNASLQQIYGAVKNIKPDGHYTDIGYALDTVQRLLDERGSNGRFKVLLLLTDLVQDAPWTSKYRGKQNSFQSPYLVEARSIKHDGWYEITLDMDIQDAVVQRTQSLYSDVVANEGIPRTEANQNNALIQGNTTVVTTNPDGTVSTSTGSSSTSWSNQGSGTGGSHITSGGSSIGGGTTGNGITSNDAFSSTASNTVNSNSTGSWTDASSGSSTVSTSALTGDTQGIVANGNNTSNTNDSLFDKYGTGILIAVGVILLLILLILLLRHLANEKKRKEEEKKKKIDLVEGTSK